MNKLWTGVGLIVLGTFMLLGFIGGDAGFGPAAIAAVLLVGILPIVGGAWLVYSHLRRDRTIDDSRAELRKQTLIAETLRYAERKGGRLTVVEVASEFAIPPEEAKLLLNDLHSQDLASIEVTDAGLLVYRFGDVQLLREKHQSRDLLNG